MSTPRSSYPGYTIPGEPIQPSSTLWLARELDKITGPMPIIAGPAMLTGEPHPVVGEDPALLTKAKKFFRNGETTVLELIARTGISPQSLRDWSDERLTAFTSQAEANNERDGVLAPRSQFFQ